MDAGTTQPPSQSQPQPLPPRQPQAIGQPSFQMQQLASPLARSWPSQAFGPSLTFPTASAAYPALSNNSVLAAPRHPLPTLHMLHQSLPTRKYRLTVRQQPKHSRMSGYGDKVDRRPVDPPPFVKVEAIDPVSGVSSPLCQAPFHFCYASLCAADTDTELTVLKDGVTRSTAGSVVSSVYRLRDTDNEEAGFCVFPDLSVRVEGAYRLKFTLFEIINHAAVAHAHVYSDVFNVYTAKRFSGLSESTFLTRSFAEQGLKLRVRKELRKRKAASLDADGAGSPVTVPVVPSPQKYSITAATASSASLMLPAGSTATTMRMFRMPAAVPALAANTVHQSQLPSLRAGVGETVRPQPTVNSGTNLLAPVRIGIQHLLSNYSSDAPSQ